MAGSHFHTPERREEEGQAKVQECRERHPNRHLLREAVPQATSRSVPHPTRDCGADEGSVHLVL